MNTQEKYMIQQKTRQKYYFLRLVNGLNEIAHKSYARIIALVYILIVILFSIYVFGRNNQNMDMFEVLQMAMWRFLYPLLTLCSAIILLIYIGAPLNATSINEGLWRIGLTNHAGESPLILNKHKIQNHRIIMEFYSNGIPYSEWEDQQDKIEAVLNVHIVKFEEGKNKKHMILHTVSGNHKLPLYVYWKKEYLSNNDFELILGQGMLNLETVNLAKIPHILIGGSTGSGKSILLKLLMMQCIAKGAKVYIADFKGGVDFSPIWHQKCRIIISELELLNVLTETVEELEKRKTILHESSCANIGEYNKKHEKKLERIIFACDEVAEVLDKTGLSKDSKELIAQIEAKLSIIARQGRAFGIHLILATQRPDANILSGQIRNNIDYRICGRADNVLSQIILDNTDAADRIPKDSQGLFINHEKTLFQSFLFDEKEVFDYE